MKQTFLLYRGKNLCCFILIVCRALINTCLIYITSVLLQSLVDTALTKSLFLAISSNRFNLCAVVILKIIDTILQYCKDVVFARSELQIMSRVFSNIIKKEQSIPGRENVADYYSIIDSDLKLAATFYQRLDNAANSLFSSVGAIIFVFNRSIKLGCVLSGLGIIIVVYNNVLVPLFGRLQKDIQEDKKSINHFAIQAYNCYVDAHFFDFNLLWIKYDEANRRYNNTTLRKAKYHIYSSVFGYVIGFLQTYLPLFLLPILFKGYSLGNLLSILKNIVPFMAIFRSVGSLLIGIRESAVGAERVLPLAEVISTGKHYLNTISRPLLPDSSLCLSINNMRYNYGDVPILSIEQLCINMSHNIGIWGKKGAGKSTFVKILIGLLRDYDGSVRINAFEIKDLDQETIAACFSYLPQDFPIFDMTIRDNFKIAAPKKTEEDYWRFLEMVNMSKEVMDMPCGIDTMISSSRISTGQRQRLSLCMTLLRDTPVLVLDEPTSNLDLENIAVIRSVIDSAQERTFIIISHDENLVDQNYDMITVQNGTIILSPNK